MYGLLGFLGFIATLQGFGSAIVVGLFHAERPGFLLRWANEYQPWVGIAVGLVGVGMLVLSDHKGEGCSEKSEEPSP